MDARTVAEVLNNIVTSAALILGGTWAYFKFVRGRTFAYRAELEVTSLILSDTSVPSVLHVSIALKNSGLARIPLNKRMKAARLFAATRPVEGTGGMFEWDRRITVPIFVEHDWLEAQEVVADELLYPLSAGDAECVAWQVEAFVGASPAPLSRKRVRWHSRRYVVMSQTGPHPTPQSAVAKDDHMLRNDGKGAHGMATRPGGQRGYGEEEERRIREELEERQKQYGEEDEKKLQDEIDSTKRGKGNDE